MISEEEKDEGDSEDGDHEAMPSKKFKSNNYLLYASRKDSMLSNSSSD